MTRKEEHHQNILHKVQEYSEMIKADKLSIRDKEMFILANEFYKRDWDTEKGHSIDGLAFQRGIVIGMQLYKQIANPEEYKL